MAPADSPLREHAHHASGMHRQLSVQSLYAKRNPTAMLKPNALIRPYMRRGVGGQVPQQVPCGGQPGELRSSVCLVAAGWAGWLFGMTSLLEDGGQLWGISHHEQQQQRVGRMAVA